METPTSNSSPQKPNPFEDPSNRPPGAAQEDAKQANPGGKKLALIIVGVVALIGIIGGSVWNFTSGDDNESGNDQQPAATSEDKGSAEESNSKTDMTAMDVRGDNNGGTNAPNGNPADSPSDSSADSPTSTPNASGAPALPDLSDPSKPKTQDGANKAAATAYNVFKLSEKGIHDNLKIQGYSEDQINKAIEKLNPDWNKQAVDMARQLSKGDSPMPKNQLKDMLTRNLGFTDEQAQYALDNM